MKLKKLSIIAAAIAICSATFGQAAFANSTNLQQNKIAQARTQNSQPPAAAGGIRLTPDQQKKLAQIQANTRSQIEKIFTAEQKRTAEARLKAGIPPRQVFAELKFTPKQRNDMQRVFLSSQQQIEALLTKEQKEQIIRQQRQIQQQQQRR